MNVPKNWRALGEWNWDQMIKNNVDVTSSENLYSQTLSLVLRVNNEYGKTINSNLRKHLPTELSDKIIIQPSEGYHFTLQWTSEELLDDLQEKLLSAIKEVKIHVPSSSTLVYPVVGKAGILGIVDDSTAQQLEQLRQNFYDIFTSMGVAIGMPPKFFPLGYISLSRYNSPFSDQDFSMLKSLEAKSAEPIQFESILLGRMDKFLTSQHSEIIWEEQLK